MGNNLPTGWAEIELKYLGEYINGRAFKPSEWRTSGLPIIRIQNLNNPNAQFNFSDAKHEEKYFVNNGDLLMAWSASLGVFIWDKQNAWLNQHIFKVIPNTRITTKKFLFYSLEGAISDFYKKSHGTGIVHITKPIFEAHKIPIPPLLEQNRIVAKLDAVMQKIENNKQRLEKIPKLLKRFRQSVLAAAVRGNLTENWRTINGIVDDWEIKKAEETCQLITKGTTPTNNGLKPSGEIPYLKVYNIVEQKVDFNYKPQFVSKEIHNNFLKRSRVYSGDVLMNIVGPPLGKVAIVPHDYEQWNINQAIAFFRAKEIILPKFIYIILCEGSPITEIEKEYRGTAGQSNISLEQCRNFLFPVPEIKEQEEIIRRVEQLFAFADKLEARYTKAKTMLDKLPQSILAKAFRGELVAQDPNDEPASVLLERIKKEKEKLAAGKKGKKSKEYSIEERPLKIAAEGKVKYKKAKA